MRMFYHMLLVTNYSDSESQRVALVFSACESLQGFAIKLHFSFQKNTVWSCYRCDLRHMMPETVCSILPILNAWRAIELMKYRTCIST